jgi:hypothetical protein
LQFIGQVEHTGYLVGAPWSHYNAGLSGRLHAKIMPVGSGDEWLVGYIIPANDLG